MIPIWVSIDIYHFSSWIDEFSEFYKSKSLCVSGRQVTATLISNNLYAFSKVDGMAKISKYSPKTGNFVKSESFKVSDDSNAVSVIFTHGNFVYRVYAVSPLKLHNFLTKLIMAAAFDFVKILIDMTNLFQSFPISVSEAQARTKALERAQSICHSWQWRRYLLCCSVNGNSWYSVDISLKMV